MTIEHHDNNDPPRLCCPEIENFVRTVRLIRPPKPGIRKGQVEVYGDSIFLNGAAGGDHIIYVEFDKRYDLCLLYTSDAADDLQPV